MTTPRTDVDAAVAGLQARWGAAAPRVVGALALAPEPAEADEAPDARPSIAPLPDDRIIHTGFAALDAILGPGGLPRSASVAIRGDGSSGRTTLALRVAAEAQSAGSVVAWLDLSRSFDPVEAVARGVRLEWLVVITPASLGEGLSIAGSLLAGRSVDMLVLDLPGGRLGKTDTPAKIADRLHRLAALARRAETLLLILDAPGGGGGSGGGGRKPAGGLATAVDQSTGIRLELARRSWVRLGRDIVGQRTEALVAHNRHGPPGRTATLRILYAEGGDRDACLTRDALLVDALEAVPGPRLVAGPVADPEAAPVAARRSARRASDARVAAAGPYPSHQTHEMDRSDPVRGPDGPSNADSLRLMQEPGTDPARQRVPAMVHASDVTCPAPPSPPPGHAPGPPRPVLAGHPTPDRPSPPHFLPAPQGVAPGASNAAHGLGSAAERARILRQEQGSAGDGWSQAGPAHPLPVPQGMPPDHGPRPTVLAPAASACRPRKKRGDPTRSAPTRAEPALTGKPAVTAAAPPPAPPPAAAARAGEPHDQATARPLRAAPSPGPGTGPTLRALPTRSARAGRQAVGSGTGHRREPGRAGHGRPARHAARERPSTRP